MNLAFFTKLNSLASRSVLLDWFFVFCATYLGWFLLAGSFYYLYLCRRSRAFLINLLTLTISVFLSWAFASLIKYNLSEPRPFESLAQSRVLFTTGGLDSFPSAHAAFFFALAFALFLQSKKWGTVYVAGALLVAVSRVIAGVHWPADIFWGAAIALITCLIIGSLFRYQPQC